TTTSLKERIRYLILLTQLNPRPVAIGLGLLLLLVALLILIRRSARGTRRARSARPVSRTEKPASEAVPTVKPAEVKSDAVSTAAVSGAAAAAMAAGTAAGKESK